MLGADELLGPLVRKAPGRRAPGHVDGTELAVRGDHRPAGVGRRRAHDRRSRLGRRTRRAARRPGRRAHARLPDRGRARRGRSGGSSPMPALAQRALVGLCRRASPTVTSSSTRAPIAPGSRRSCSRSLASGRGPPATSLMRGLGDPDVFLPTDLGVRHALAALGVRRPPRRRWRASPSAGARGARTRCTTSGAVASSTQPRCTAPSTRPIGHARRSSPPTLGSSRDPCEADGRRRAAPRIGR